jgi:hypothetical protein
MPAMNDVLIHEPENGEIKYINEYLIVNVKLHAIA